MGILQNMGPLNFPIYTPLPVLGLGSEAELQRLCVPTWPPAYDFEWSNLADERVAIVRGIIRLLLLR